MSAASMPQPSQKLRYAVIGVAGVGQHHVRFAHRHADVDVVALVDLDQKALAQAMSMNGFDARKVSCYRTHGDMIAGLADNNIDAVSICTPHAFLYSIAADCLKQGIHTFIEKPFAMRLSQADILLGLAREKNLQIAVAYQYRTFKTPRFFKNMISNGALGDISRVLWTWFEFRPQSYYSRDAWRANWNGAGGGLLMNQISHELDLMRWLFGEPREVSATLLNQFGRCELDDMASICICFENGTIATLQASMNQPHAYAVKHIVGERGAVFISQAGRSATNPNDEIDYHCYSSLRDSAESLGDDHAQPDVVVANKQQRLAVGLPAKRSKFKEIVSNIPLMSTLFRVLRNAGGGRRASSDSLPETGHGKLMDDFISCILNGHSPLVSGDDARKTLELINAVIMSAVEKRSITLPLNPEQYDAVFDSLVDGSSKIDARFSNER